MAIGRNAGNGISRESAFPNGIWERGNEESEIWEREDLGTSARGWHLGTRKRGDERVEFGNEGTGALNL